MKKNYSMFVKNIIATTKKYKFSIHKILFYEILFILRGFKGNKISFDINDEFSANIPCPYYFLIKIRKFLDNKQIKSFIDLGCGNGRVIFFFNRYFKIKYYGVEFFKEPFNYCKTIFFREQNIQIENEDFRNLNFLKKDIDCYFFNEPLKNKKEFEFVISSIYQKYNKDVYKKYYIILVNVKRDDLNFFSNLNLLDFEIINTRGYYIYSNEEKIK